jgi:hypothetical protein
MGKIILPLGPSFIPKFLFPPQNYVSTESNPIKFAHFVNIVRALWGNQSTRTGYIVYNAEG